MVVLSSRIQNIVRVTFKYVYLDFRVLFSGKWRGEGENWIYVKIIYVPSRAVITWHYCSGKSAFLNTEIILLIVPIPLFNN